MNKDPAFLFYYQDFLVGTILMSDEEVGKYIKILCHLADKRSLTIDEIKIIVGGDVSKKVLTKLSIDENNCYYNKRLKNEVEKRRKYSESRRKNRLSKEDNDSYDSHMSTHMSDHMSTHMSTHMGNENENILNKANKGRLLINKDNKIGKSSRNIKDHIANNKSNDYRSKFIKPTVEQIEEYCEERKNGLNGQKIFDHYEANGWMRGKTKIKDWKACVRTWERNDNNNSKDFFEGKKLL